MAGDLAVPGELELAGTAVGATIAPLQSALASTQAAGEGMPQRLDLLERTVASLVELVGAVVIRAGTTRTEVEQGDDLGMLGISRRRRQAPPWLPSAISGMIEPKAERRRRSCGS